MREWQHAINVEGFPLRLSSDKPLANLAGFLPAHLNDKLSGFECHFIQLSDITSTYPEIEFGHAWKYAMALNWIGDFNEMQAAWMAATAYARATNGIVFDEEAGQLYDGVQAAQAGPEIVRDITKILELSSDTTPRSNAP